MPLFLKSNPEEDKSILGVWKISEPDDYFLDSMELYPEEITEILSLKSRKKTEWLASRYLLHILSGRALRGPCLKDEYGKPYLKDSGYFISMSHSADMTAVIASPVTSGVDIQILVPKIERIAHRYLSPEEISHIKIKNRIEILHVYWGAKESLYKAYGRKSLDFRQHLYIEKFDYDPEGFIFYGWIDKDGYYKKYKLYCSTIDNFILTYAIEY